MYIEDKYCRIFHSNDMTCCKYNELYDYAVNLREHKNIVSEYINNNLYKYLEYKKFDFIKEMRCIYHGIVSSSFDYQLYTQIYTSYQNKFNAILRSMTFKTIIYNGIEYYSRNTKYNKAGDFKNFKLTQKNTKLTSCLTYLARYGSETIKEYIEVELETNKELSKSKISFYHNILNYINKYGFIRLYRLAMMKRNNTIKRYSRKPIEFVSLTFSGRTRKNDIISYNKNYNSIIKSFIELSWTTRKSLFIPVKFNKSWFGNLKEYNKNHNNFEYTITFNEKEKQVRIHICKDQERYIPDAGYNIIGIDVNCKHNLFKLSDGTEYDYNRQLVSDYCKLKKQTDDLKKKNKDYKIGKRKRHKFDKLKEKMIKSEQQLISKMCKNLKDAGINHIVMENLDNSFGKSYAKDKDNSDTNYNDIVKFIGLSSLKNEVEHIARNYDIALSTVPSEYTSQLCPECGCIDKENRPNQETFKCVNCEHENNADLNAAINIKNRVLSTVLRDKLLKQNDNGSYSPKDKLTHQKVKDILLSLRRS